jgi:hypothetical protein
MKHTIRKNCNTGRVGEPYLTWAGFGGWPPWPLIPLVIDEGCESIPNPNDKYGLKV